MDSQAEFDFHSLQQVSLAPPTPEVEHSPPCRGETLAPHPVEGDRGCSDMSLEASTSPASSTSSGVRRPFEEALLPTQEREVRRRLTVKQPDPHLEEVEPLVFPYAGEECPWSQEGYWDFALPGWEHMSHRQKYVTISNRFYNWCRFLSRNLVEADFQEGEWQQNVFKMVRKGSHKTKDWMNPLRHIHLKHTKAPRPVVEWSTGVWPDESDFIFNADGKKEGQVSHLLTYQGDWGILPVQSQDLGWLSLAPLQKIEMYVRDKYPAFLDEGIQSLKAYAAERKLRHQVEDYAVALELCTKTWRDEHILRVHAHVSL